MARNASIPTLQVPIGPNCSLDFGPFADAVAVGEWGADRGAETVMVTAEGEGAHEVALDYIEETLRDEMEDGQPVHLSTGDVGADPSTGETVTVGTIEVPLIAGYAVQTWTLGESPAYGLGTLGDNSATARRQRTELERELRTGGGIIDG